MRILLHSFTFRDYDVEHAIAKGKVFGYDALELFPSHFGTGDLDRLKQAIDLSVAAGLPVETVDFSVDLLETKEKQEPSIRAVQQLLHAIDSTGVKRINGHVGSLVASDPNQFSNNGSVLATPEMYTNAAEGLRAICDTAAQVDIDVVLEIHMNTLHDSVATYLRLHELVGKANLGATLDAGNMYAIAHAEKGEEAILAAKDVLKYVHLKNCIAVAGTFSYTVDLQSGDINHDKLCRVLHRIDYDGDVCIEYCGEGDPHPRARADHAYLSSLRQEILA